METTNEKTHWSQVSFAGTGATLDLFPNAAQQLRAFGAIFDDGGALPDSDISTDLNMIDWTGLND